MAGYLFAFSDEEAMWSSINSLTYSTLMNPVWRNPTSPAALGDYVTMHAGDNVYFFSQRKIYGIGEIINVEPGRCVTENFEGATSKEPVIWSEVARGAKVNLVAPDGRIGRWIVAFKPSPFFFSHGIDMDDLLSSRPTAFRALRAFWKKSFIKLDDEENEAFRAAILRGNLDELNDRRGETYMLSSHEKLAIGDYPDVPGLLASSRKRDGSLSSEMLLEVGLLYQLTNYDPKTRQVFGRWDYLSHQVNASPFKPVDYMDHMDVFGYRWIEDYRPVIESYLVAELKKDEASISDVPQIMKYVDWVNDEYSHGDYSLIKAFLIAFDFRASDDVSRASERDYVVGSHPATARKWNDLTLVKYYLREDGYIEFSMV